MTKKYFRLIVCIVLAVWLFLFLAVVSASAAPCKGPHIKDYKSFILKIMPDAKTTTFSEAEIQKLLDNLKYQKMIPKDDDLSYIVSGFLVEESKDVYHIASADKDGNMCGKGSFNKQYYKTFIESVLGIPA